MKFVVLEDGLPVPAKAGRWRIQCANNLNVEYVVAGPIKPNHCPACGRPCRVVEEISSK